jgi:hypothetical protein
VIYHISYLLTSDETLISSIKPTFKARVQLDLVKLRARSSLDLSSSTLIESS